ncbi:MAG: GSCFA domain-containing protein, partial [Schleiferiaceae bacterium]
MKHKQIEVGNLKGSDSPFFFLGIGSCFVQHFEGFAQQHHLPMYCNPLGTSFNPISIGRQLQWLFSNDFPLLPPVDFQGIYHQLDAANKFQHSDSAALQSATDSIRSEVLDSIKKHQGHQNILILSFGTAHAWMYKDQVVNNCHKLPNPLFERQLLSIEDIVGYWAK